MPGKIHSNFGRSLAILFGSFSYIRTSLHLYLQLFRPWIRTTKTKVYDLQLNNSLQFMVHLCFEWSTLHAIFDDNLPMHASQSSCQNIFFFKFTLITHLKIITSCILKMDFIFFFGILIVISRLQIANI